MPLFRHERSYTCTQALTWVKGRHQVRGGIDIVRHELNHYQAEFGSFGGVRGGFRFTGNITGAPGYNATIYNELAAFTLGLPDIRQKDVQEIEMTGREWQHALFLADHWNVNEKLTLNLGLRLERYPLMTRKDSGIERLDYSTYTVLLGGRGDVPEDVGINVKSVYLAPAWARCTATDKTVVRAGYGSPTTRYLVAAHARSFPYDVFFSTDRRAVLGLPDQRRHPAGDGSRPQLGPRQCPQHVHALAEPLTTSTAGASSR